MLTLKCWQKKAQMMGREIYIYADFNAHPVTPLVNYLSRLPVM